MKKIIILLCLGLIGCVTVSEGTRPAGKAGQKAVTEAEQKELDSIIAIFSDAIKDNPNYAGAYYNRGMAYFYKREYSKCLHDILKAEALGVTVDQEFIKLIKKFNESNAKKR
ncbi:MAG: hypothetical protein PHV92_05440 [Candidatus Omnitrophica bacterium]|jgi:tetratricopeptide (TPR) repeat protein|nr:hypothetical protein [Candidatus Omnitrophota bacterium]MDD5518304.1 hypothetical protein [Candidatus Omnitrophota bacterium]